MWCFVGVKSGDSLQETIVSIRLEFDEGKPFLQLLQMENCEKTEKNFNEKLFQGNSILIIVKVVTKYKSLHDVVSCKRLCFHIIEFLFKNEDKIINFCSLNRLNCKTNFDKQVLADLIDYNYQYVLYYQYALYVFWLEHTKSGMHLFQRCFTGVWHVALA